MTSSFAIVLVKETEPEISQLTKKTNINKIHTLPVFKRHSGLFKDDVALPFYPTVCCCGDSPIPSEGHNRVMGVTSES